MNIEKIKKIVNFNIVSPKADEIKQSLIIDCLAETAMQNISEEFYLLAKQVVATYEATQAEADFTHS